MTEYAIGFLIGCLIGAPVGLVVYRLRHPKPEKPTFRIVGHGVGDNWTEVRDD